MKSIHVSALLCFVVSACSNTYTYVKDGNADALQDALVECKTEMARQIGDDATEAMDKCMAAKGYEKKVDKYRL